MGALGGVRAIASTVQHARRTSGTSGVLTNLGGSLAVQAIGIVTGTLLARGLGPHDRGVFAAMVLLPLLVVQLGEFGLGSALAYFAARQPGAAKSYIRFAQRATLILSIGLVPAGVLTTYIGLTKAGVDPILSSLVLAGFLIPVLLFARYMTALAQGLLRFDVHYTIRIATVLSIAVVLLIEFVTDLMTVRSALAAYGVGLAVTLAVTLGAKRYLGAGEAAGEIPPARTLASYGLRSHFGALYPVEGLLVDQMIVAFSLGPRELGIYVVAAAFTTLPRVLAVAVATAALPQIARASDARRRAAGFLGVGAVVLIPLGVALTAGMPWLVSLIFGEKFAPAVVPAQLLVWGSVLFGLRRIAGDAIRGLGVPGRASVIELATWPVVIVVLAVAAQHGLTAVAGALVAVQMVALVASLVVLEHALRRQALV